MSFWKTKITTFAKNSRNFLKFENMISWSNFMTSPFFHFEGGYLWEATTFYNVIQKWNLSEKLLSNHLFWWFWICFCRKGFCISEISQKQSKNFYHVEGFFFFQLYVPVVCYMSLKISSWKNNFNVHIAITPKKTLFVKNIFFSFKN